ncbi:MAG: hypothetical protein ACYCVZ_04940 [Streptosporangiaceae bacterium]
MAATPVTTPCSRANLAGSRTRVHALPFQCKISAAPVPPPIVASLPTAQAFVADVAATAFRSPP